MFRISCASTRSLFLGAVMALTLSGCFTTTISSGEPPAEPKIEYDDKWHHGFLWGMAEVSGPYNLQEICPQGWAEIKTETSFLTGLVSAITRDIYTPQAVTVACKAGGGPTAAANEEAIPEAEAAAEAASE